MRVSNDVIEHLLRFHGRCPGVTLRIGRIFQERQSDAGGCRRVFIVGVFRVDAVVTQLLLLLPPVPLVVRRALIRLGELRWLRRVSPALVILLDSWHSWRDSFLLKLLHSHGLRGSETDRNRMSARIARDSGGQSGIEHRSATFRTAQLKMIQSRARSNLLRGLLDGGRFLRLIGCPFRRFADGIQRLIQSEESRQQLLLPLELFQKIAGGDGAS